MVRMLAILMCVQLAEAVDLAAAEEDHHLVQLQEDLALKAKAIMGAATVALLLLPLQQEVVVVRAR